MRDPPGCECVRRRDRVSARPPSATPARPGSASASRARRRVRRRRYRCSPPPCRPMRPSLRLARAARRRRRPWRPAGSRQRPEPARPTLRSVGWARLLARARAPAAADHPGAAGAAAPEARPPEDRRRHPARAPAPADAGSHQTRAVQRGRAPGVERTHSRRGIVGERQQLVQLTELGAGCGASRLLELARDRPDCVTQRDRLAFGRSEVRRGQGRVSDRAAGQLEALRQLSRSRSLCSGACAGSTARQSFKRRAASGIANSTR